MNTFMRSIALAACALFVGMTANAQTALTATTLSSALTNNSLTLTLTSATGVTAANAGTPTTALYILDAGQLIGELVSVKSVSGTTITTMGRNSQFVRAHASGAIVLIGPPRAFPVRDPHGTCTAANTAFTPWVNTVTGLQWLCSASTGTWVPGWSNTSKAAQLLSGTATASVAGATAIAGPLVRISGTNAITSFTMSAGWNGDSFCVIPTGAYTTTATNNIGKATTAVAAQTQCWTWNSATSSFMPSY